MAFSHVFVVACVTLATSKVYGNPWTTYPPTLTDPPTTDPTTTYPPHCECINPFIGKEGKEYRWLNKIQTAKLLLCGRKMCAKILKSLSTFSSVINSEDKSHPGETRTSCVDPRGPPNATSTATLTVATSSLLPVLQGCLLIWLKFFQKCNYIIWNRFMFIFTFFYICLYIQVQVFPSLWRLQWHRMGVKGPGKIILDFCNFAKPVGIIKYNHPEKTWHCLCWFCLSNRFNAIHHSAGLERFGCPWVPWLSLGRVKNMDLITM